MISNTWNLKAQEITMKAIFLMALLLLNFVLLAQQKINILIKTGVPDAAIFLDDNYIGMTGTSGEKIIKNVTRGRHIVKILKKDYAESRQAIDVDELTNTFTFSLMQNPGIQPGIRENNQGGRNGSLPTTGYNNQGIEIILVVFIVTLGLVAFTMGWIYRKSKNHGVLGKFELRRIIGKGGIATIYKAKDMVNKKIVALKVLDPAFITDRDLVYKFFSEGDAIFKINKEFPDAPVVKVSEFGRDREKSLGVPFIAMELVKGTDLLKIIKQNGSMPVSWKLHIVREVARGLGAAHKMGIFHGDITPDNIIVNSDKVTLIDFGVALQEHDNYKNMDATVMGKPVYMSPEQCAGDPIDDKSDVYSLGVILFLMFYGIPPFISQNPLEIMNMHRETPLPELDTPIPVEIKNLVYRMLDKIPRNRPGTLELEETLASLIYKYKVQ
jgi:serine/threonine-protein kinase